MPAPVSLIVPTYNAAVSLPDCLSSIARQTHSTLQVLVIDDGSTDATQECIKKFAQQDSRFTLIAQPNSGVASARNTGLDYATGEMIAFVDADDTVDPNYIASLMAVRSQADLISCGYRRVGPHPRAVSLGRSGALSRDEMIANTLCSERIGGGCWNKLFRRNLIEQAQLRFDATLSVGEDMLFLTEYALIAERYWHVDLPLYNYVSHPNSITRRAYSQRVFTAKDASIINAVERIAEITQQASPDIQASVDYRRARSALRVLLQMLACRHWDAALAKRLQQNLRIGLPSTLKSHHSRMMEKAMITLAAGSPRITYQLLSLALRVAGPRIIPTEG